MMLTIGVVVKTMMMMMMMMGKPPEAVASALEAETKGKSEVWPCFVNRTIRYVRCMGSRVTQIPSNIPTDTAYLEFKQTHLKEIPDRVLTGLLVLKKLAISENSQLERICARALTGLPQLNSILISENGVLETIGGYAFAHLPELVEITISNSKHLSVIHPDAFMGLPKLKYLIISNTGLKDLPNFTRIYSTAHDFLLDLQDNIYIERIPSNAFRGLCTQTITDVRLTRNGIKEIERGAFNNTKLQRLFLTDNQELSHIHGDAFVGSSGLVVLDVSHTLVSSLPESILGSLRMLVAISVFRLKELPPLKLFTRLNQANLTYPSHCCAFRNLHRNRSRWNQLCSHPEAQDDIPFYTEHCSNLTNITCSPAPDAFNPCEDIMAYTSLRVLIWVISILALLGNTAVLLVLLGSRAKLTVPRFLMCHLAFADLCMGIYLLIIASVDTFTRGHYYNHAIDWQTGMGCTTAGFFTVFSSELSVFTLTAITVERWHTITHALRIDRKLRLRHASVIMVVGWIFSLMAALLPTAGVSSYGKVSICLPMDVEGVFSQIYIVCLLLLNVVAFFCVCGCYLAIYLSISTPAAPPAHDDTRIAQHMALLIFPYFLCMAPISFFAISAAFKFPLITVSHAKLLLVLFYPINSCSNPFLYAFFTRNFRRDFVLLAASFGLCKVQALIYRYRDHLGPTASMGLSKEQAREPVHHGQHQPLTLQH